MKKKDRYHSVDNSSQRSSAESEIIFKSEMKNKGGKKTSSRDNTPPNQKINVSPARRYLPNARQPSPKTQRLLK